MAPDLQPRACGAVIRDGKILMVRHTHGTEDYWTLPGGGVAEGESFEDAAVREVLEETGLKVAVKRLLWEGREGPFYEKCFLLEDIGQPREPALGEDPELAKGKQILQELAWFPMEEKANDIQVAKVIQLIRE